TQLATINPDGGTDHMVALRTALALRPEVVFFLTDADLMTNGDVNEILSEIGTTRFQAVEFGHGPPIGPRTPLHRLPNTTGATPSPLPPAARTSTSTSPSSRGPNAGIESRFRQGERGASPPCLGVPSLTGQGADAPARPDLPLQDQIVSESPGASQDVGFLP